MLVNDDGVDAPGIDTLRRALQEAGHDVTIVAPATGQSAVGTSLTLGTWEVTAFEGGFAVDATPSTTVYTGLDALLTGEDRPDLVVSGANEGANIGLEATASGTLSAAAASVFNYDVPAIAVSAGIDAEGEVPEGLYDTSGDVLAELIDDLIDTAPANGALLPEGLGLNVNLPADAALDDTAFTVLDEATPYGFTVGERPDGTVGFVLGEPVTSDDPDSEGGNFADGRITITPIDGNYAADLPTTLRVGDALDLTFGLPGAGGDDDATPGGSDGSDAPAAGTAASLDLAALGIDTLAGAVPAAG